MLVERGEQITHFQKEKYYNLHLDCGGLEAVKEKLFDTGEVWRLQEACEGGTAVVESCVSTEKAVSPPKLYDLTTLQRESNRYFGYTAKETLDFTQSLYEKKLVTYPRTDSQYLTEDMGQTARQAVAMACEKYGFSSLYPLEPDVERMMDNSKVSDHHAIIPTAELKAYELQELSKGEQDILQLISVRLLCAGAQKYIYQETEITVSCAGEIFTAKGKAIQQMGWKAIEAEFRKHLGVKSRKEGEESLLPDVVEGQTFHPVTVSVSEHFTTPRNPTARIPCYLPWRLRNRELMRKQRKKGLGTPATRASIIEKLVSSGYAVRKGKQLLATQDGADLISVLPEYLRSAAMTAEWENRLLQIERGELPGQEFLDGIEELIDRMLLECGELSVEEQNRFYPREQIGVCPVCGSPVYESKRNFFCGTPSECAFALWKENRYLSGMKKRMDKKMAAELLKDGRTYVPDLYSQKKGRTFAAYLCLDTEEGKASFRLEFPKKKSKK